MLVLSAAVSLLIRSGCVISATLYLILCYWRSKEEYLYIRSIYAKSVLDRANGSRIRD